MHARPNSLLSGLSDTPKGANQHSARYDFWVSFSKGFTRYDNPRLNVNGVWSLHKGYMTDILRDYALRFLHEALLTNLPFTLIFAPNAPHAPLVPPREIKIFNPDLPPHRPPSFNEADVSHKPRWLQQLSLLSPKQQGAIDSLRRRQLQTLWSLDGGINAIFDLLDHQGKLHKTVIFYLYVETKRNRPELYDLKTDPYQLENRIDDPAYAKIVMDMQARLRLLRPAMSVFTTEPHR